MFEELLRTPLHIILRFSVCIVTENKDYVERSRLRYKKKKKIKFHKSINENRKSGGGGRYYRRVDSYIRVV